MRAHGGTCVTCAGRLVHRLDRNTSGALVVARTADAAAWLSQAFRLPAQGLSARQPLPPARGVPSIEKHYQVFLLLRGYADSVVLAPWVIETSLFLGAPIYSPFETNLRDY